jgi:predicted small metal-binding protein
VLVEVTCRCGWTARGSKAKVVADVQAHGRSAHQQQITPAEVRAIWRVVEGDGPKR